MSFGQRTRASIVTKLPEKNITGKFFDTDLLSWGGTILLITTPNNRMTNTDLGLQLYCSNDGRKRNMKQEAISKYFFPTVKW